MNDDELAALLAEEPRVSLDERRGRLLVETREEQIPDKPDVCPVCGEEYDYRALHGMSEWDADRPGEGYALFHHGERRGFHPAGCRVDDYWTSRATTAVDYERAKRVSDGHMEASA